VRAHRGEPGPAHHRTENSGDDDRVVRVTEHRNEIGDQIDGHRQVDQQQRQPDTNSPGQGLVGGEAAHQPQHVGQQSQCFAQQEP
jgi:hypothetical protein